MTIEEHQTLYNYTINDTVYWRNNIINSLVENGDALKIKMAALSYWPASSEFN